jgi:pimeloyl-ACP methyl ester carboxylesterase
LPGGPGMGSESLIELIHALEIDAPLYRVDLPDDGKNIIGQSISLQRWQQSILEISNYFGQVIWTGHSFGGMLLQTIPELESMCQALVLMNTAPDNFWYSTFSDRASKLALPNISVLKKTFMDTPNDEHYKAYMLNSLSYYFIHQGLFAGLKLFQRLPFNHLPYLWALKAFHPVYRAKWTPQIPCLILTSSEDHMTPKDLFKAPKYHTDNFMHVNIPKAGHFPWIEQPELVAKGVSSFISGL